MNTFKFQVVILHLVLHEPDELRLLRVSKNFILVLIPFLDSGLELLWFGTDNKMERNQFNTKPSKQ